MILHRYFAKRFLMTFAGVLAVFVMIIGFINVIEQMRRGGSVDATFSDVLTLALLSVPQSIYDILPLVMIITAISLFLGLARSSEMVVTRAAGLTFAQSGSPQRRVEAAQASLDDGAWRLQDAKVWPLNTDTIAEARATTHDTLDIASTLTADQIRDSFGTPASIPIWELPAFIERLKAAGFSAQRHQVWLQRELALPLFLVSMVMIGAAFTLRHQRGGRTGLMVLYAILLSFTIYFLRNFAQIMGENGQLPAILAAWAPPLAAIGLSMGMLLHQEDG